MEAQSKDTTTHGQCRTTLAIAAISALSLAIITPYLATSGFRQSSSTKPDQVRKEQGQPSVEPLDTSQQEQQTMQQVTGNHSNIHQGQTTVVVNGQKIEVPANGLYGTSTDDASGHTTITVESSHSGSSNINATSDSSSVQLDVHSESSSSLSD